MNDNALATASMSVQTGALVGMLTDVLRSASKDATLPMVHGVMLHVDQHEDGPVLVATATDRFTLGQAWIRGSGKLPQLWLTYGNLSQVLPLLRPFSRRGDTFCDVTVEGRTVKFQQNPLPGMANMSVAIECGDPDRFPKLTKTFPGTEPTSDVPTFDPTRLAAPMAVAKRRGEHMRIEHYGLMKPSWVYVGSQYRCLVMPMRTQDTTVSPWFDLPNTTKTPVAA